MIRVTVELIPGGTGAPVNLAGIEIWNDLADSLESGGSRGSYRFRTLGRNGRETHYSQTAGKRICNWPRRSKPVLALVAAVLREAGYS